MKSLLYSVTIGLLFIGASGCWENGRFGIRGEGPIVERKLNLDKIKGISLPGSAKVFLTQGSAQEVRILGQENIIDNLNLEVHGEVWQIDNKRSVWQSEPVKIYITLETLRSIKISGSSDVEFVNHFTNQKDLVIRISGSGKIDLDMEAGDIKVNISGSGDLFMKGSADYLDFSITGSGNINAYDLSARKADVRVSGSGGMELSVDNRLDAHISGSGNVYYKGNPKVNTSISGSGSVRAR
ncbi:MAG: DUF2807 domain-containing protein [Porphyromonadaceae bacterium]|nr:MAG: DUF2807 domain-containing protein [Porphyromonadaceae bacterium]